VYSQDAILPLFTATKLVREWIDIHSRELEENWNLSRAGQPFKEIAPLD
jgi:hypothetical protein